MASLPEALAQKKGANADHIANLTPLTRQADTGSTIGDINYTKTRVITPNAAVLRENRVINSPGGDPVVDAYKVLCIQVLQRLRGLGGNALAVVSPGEHEGKTLTAINLAISLAKEVDQTVLLVDANLREPAVHRYLGIRPEGGLRDYLIDSVPLDRILINPGINRLVVLPGGRPLQNSTEMLGSTKMEALVHELKSRYPSRVVLFDLPPVLSVADAMAFSPYVDAALLVVQENKTGRAEMRRAMELLKSVEVLGTVLNGAAEVARRDEEIRPGGGRRWFFRR